LWRWFSKIWQVKLRRSREEIVTQKAMNNEHVFINTSTSESKDEGDIPLRRRMNMKHPVGQQRTGE
jgi:hypothetical protein